MTAAERRQVPRTALERLTYIRIEPDNGGIVLNVSREGLCFQSVAPVDRNATIDFSVCENNHWIKARAELVWTDDARTKGGLRFVLSSDTRSQISDWVDHTIRLEEDKAATPVISVDGDEASTPIVGLAEDSASAGKFSRLFAFRPLVGWRPYSKADPESSSGLTVAPPKRTAPLKLSGFSAGVVTGVLVSVIALSLILSGYAHRRELGESLIRLGERLGARREVPMQKASRPTPVAAPAAPVTATQGATAPSKAIDSQRSQPRTPEQSAAKDEGPKLHPPVSTMSSPQARSVGTRPIVVSRTEEKVLAPPALVALGVHPLPPPKLVLEKVDVLPRPSPPGGAVVHRSLAEASGLNLEMYFDLGKFKDELAAQNLSDRVARLGLRTTVLQRRGVLKTSFQVLVGPYSSGEEQIRIEKDLVSRGYKPRPFERGSKHFSFGSHLNVNGSSVPFGDLTIRWESYVADAKVQFAQGNNASTTAHGRWKKLPQKSSRDEYMYAKNADGSKTLLEVYFSGLDRALVFRR